jgi:RecA/RadA recombinase
MKVQQFLEHHGIAENPFGQEDAQVDHIFKQYCLEATHHPAWDKIFGNPANPSTSVVFGEKGSGKTALRLQIAGELQKYNRDHPEEQSFIVEYDDFNPFLDCFRERLHGRQRKPERALSHWRLWDHMDAILKLSVTRLVDAILDETEQTPDATDNTRPNITTEQLARLTKNQKRDLLLLAAFYDHTFDQPAKQRWTALKRKLKFHAWWSQCDLAAGAVSSAAIVALQWNLAGFKELFVWWIPVLLLAGWSPWLWRQGSLMWKAWRVSRQIRVFDHLPNSLRQLLSRFDRQQIAGQPIPGKERSDDRYELLLKLQNLLKTLGFKNMAVLVDRVDEPHLVNGSPERMRDLLWPMFDNKFLKHPDIGFKLLLPAEVVYYLDREKKEFYERSRLDKQNLITSLEWTGETLYDMANERIRACATASENEPGIRNLFDETIGQDQLVLLFARLRVPRHLFKFLYRLLVDHCNKFTDDNPQWTIGNDTLQTTMALFTRDLEAFDRGQGTG